MKIQPLTSLQRRPNQILAALKRNQRPVLLTDNGKPAAYLLDVAAYEASQQRTNLLEALARGEQDIREGRVLTHAQVKRKLARWLPR